MFDRYFVDPVAVYGTVLVRDVYEAHRERETSPRWSGLACVSPWKNKASDLKGDRDTAVQYATGYFPSGVEIQTTDLVGHEGDMWEVYGLAEDWRFGALKHVRVDLKKVVC
ncbi:hypothetical protein MOV08_05200 [Streptomyces yunnanensis]|uniref:Head-to-tail stopper n=1 Tax=Streptomyces yunnanensis TaxID=156453 RepID=A0ABY8A3F8_9ACTN|nr:hypothetical protein [Streptomyces yunnanensis]WEB38759.1 hypothetical protein MOV08_05200 [Streptomyces yunnanensis]